MRAETAERPPGRDATGKVLHLTGCAEVLLTQEAIALRLILHHICESDAIG
jgi:hypothetical protein